MISRSILMLTVSLLAGSAVPAFALTGARLTESPVVATLTLSGTPMRDVAEQNRFRVAQVAGAEQSFAWSAEKSDNEISLSGQVPNPAIQAFLAVRAGRNAEDDTSVAEGGPDTFVPYSLAGLDALNGLISGRVSYTGSKWTLSGYAQTRVQLEAVSAALEAAVDMTDWVVFTEVATSAAAESGAETAEVEATEPPGVAAELLRWSVSKSVDGQLRFDGALPHAALQNYLGVRAGDDLQDNSEVGGTPPPDFISSAIAAVDAAKALQSGRVAFTGSKWTIGGYAESRDAVDRVLADLAAAVDISDWLVFVEVSPDAPAPEVDVPAEAEPEVADSTAMVEPEFQFNALKSNGGDIALSGNVPSAAFGSYAGVIAGGVDANALQVNFAAPETFITEAAAALRALTTLESGLLAFENDKWSLIGDALSDADASAVSAAITGLPGGDSWTLDIAVVPVFQLCAEVVANFSDTHTILFAPGSSNLTPESAEALAELADDLVKCPAADLHIEGHTDADGPEDSNMALSVSRAEAVIAQLIELGLDDRRLYAIGYGETLPVATNDTVAGKAQNRRIVFELVR